MFSGISTSAFIPVGLSIPRIKFENETQHYASDLTNMYMTEREFIDDIYFGGEFEKRKRYLTIWMIVGIAIAWFIGKYYYQNVETKKAYDFLKTLIM